MAKGLQHVSGPYYNVPNFEASKGANADSDNIVANSDSLPYPFAAKKKKDQASQTVLPISQTALMTLWAKVVVLLRFRRTPLLRAHHGVFQKFQRLLGRPIFDLEDEGAAPQGQYSG